jgi:hypothetical protein
LYGIIFLTVGFHTMKGISWLAERLLPSPRRTPFHGVRQLLHYLIMHNDSGNISKWGIWFWISNRKELTEYTANCWDNKSTEVLALGSSHSENKGLRNVFVLSSFSI